MLFLLIGRVTDIDNSDGFAAHLAHGTADLRSDFQAIANATSSTLRELLSNTSESGNEDSAGIASECIDRLSKHTCLDAGLNHDIDTTANYNQLQIHAHS